MSQRVLVTAALPYANGRAHLGHLVEYCQTDMYVRALKRLGEDALYICASDAHGTPIEVNAKKLGIEPEKLVADARENYLIDFAKFDVAFDHFSSTHSETNKKLVETVYAKLRENGQLEDREIDGTWCETDQRFLPDRFVRGTCPKCETPDQYGDVCESCHSTYAPTDLKEPKCVMCGNAPVIKKSTHVFFKLSDPKNVAFLAEWIDSGTLQPDIANYVRNWIEGGLLDWCISRDGPYFGFQIPDREGKYFYVWLDAPLGYAASSKEWGEKNGVDFDALWQSPETTRVEHIIGKDIVYFHTLFWPAVLNAMGYTLPSGVHVHGMLTVDGEKMSKSRGTFIDASVFAEHVEPQALRYYYACKFGSSSEDLDLSFDDFVQRVNAELVNKHANLFSRAAQFLGQKLDGNLGELPFTAEEAQGEPTGDGSPLDLARRVVAHCRNVEELYRKREFGHVVRELSAVADIGNEYMQGQEPWAQLKTDQNAAKETCTFAINVCHALAMYLWPIVPRFSEQAAAVIGSSIGKMDSTQLWAERDRPLGEFQRLFERIDKKAIDEMVEATKASLQTEASKKAAAKEAPAGGKKEEITFEQFQGLDLRVGEVVSAEPVKKSKKLLRLEIDIGEETPRQVVAGISLAYTPEQLIGTKVVVVANLKPAKLMGVESRGMVLAAGDGDGLAVLRLDKDQAAGTPVR